MATFAGSRIAPNINVKEKHASSNLESYTFYQTHGRGWRLSAPRQGAWGPQFPKQVIHHNRIGVVSQHVIKLIYNRIHILPRLIELGNITNAQTHEVTVWNAFFQGMELQNIQRFEADDITLGNQPLPPFMFKTLEDRTWSVGIAADGAAVVDAKINWIFQGGNGVQLSITGQRISVWPWATNWKDEVVERLEWLTSVNSSPIGSEQRRSLRQAPRRTFEVHTLAHDMERRYLDLAVANWGARFWAIPIWHDIQQLTISAHAGDDFIHCRTYGFDFRVGGLVVLRGLTAFDYETVQVKSIETTRLILEKPIQRSWIRRRTRLYPARVAKLVEQPQIRRITDRTCDVQAKFISTEPNDWAKASPQETYRAHPVFRLPPEESQDLTSTYMRIQTGIDNQVDIPGVVDTANLAFFVNAHSWDPHTREQHMAMRNFFYWLAGRFKAVWMPTHCEDLTIVVPPLFGDNSIDVRNAGYTRYGAQRPGRRDIRIQFHDGRIIMRRIIGSVVLQNGYERLSLDTSLPFNFELREVERISFMALMRLDQDFIEIQHKTDSDGLGYVKTTWRSLRDDLEEQG